MFYTDTPYEWWDAEQETALEQARRQVVYANTHGIIEDDATYHLMLGLAGG